MAENPSHCHEDQSSIAPAGKPSDYVGRNVAPPALMEHPNTSSTRTSSVNSSTYSYGSSAGVSAKVHEAVSSAKSGNRTLDLTNCSLTSIPKGQTDGLQHLLVCICSLHTIICSFPRRYIAIAIALYSYIAAAYHLYGFKNQRMGIKPEIELSFFYNSGL
jgi:hypothetical protein